MLHRLSANVFARLQAQCAAHINAVLGALVPPDARGGDSLPPHVDRVALLARVLDAWRDHCDGMHVIRSVFLALDAKQLSEASTSSAIDAAALGAPTSNGGLWEMGLQLFRNGIEPSALCQACVDGVLELVRQDRARGPGAMDNDANEHLRNAVEMLSALRLYDTLEEHYLNESDAYYQAEGAELMKACASSGTGEEGAEAVGRYLRRVEQRLSDEASRASAMRLEGRTCFRLVDRLEHNLIGIHVASLLSTGFDAMCDGRRMEDLERMHRLFARAVWTEERWIQHKGSANNWPGLPLRDALAAYTKNRAGAIVMDASREDSMVQSLLDLKDCLDAIVAEAFSSEQALVAALKESLESAVNARHSSNKPAELVARYLDAALRGVSVAAAPTPAAGAAASPAAAGADASPSQSSPQAAQTTRQKLTEEELDRLIDKALVLFRCLQGKDVFEAFYKNHLAKRLLLGRSVSVDAEKNVITKLRHECGSQYTSKLEGMFKDVDLSRDVVKGFRSSPQAQAMQSAGKDVDFNVCVLTTGYWPSATYDGVGGQRGAAAAGAAMAAAAASGSASRNGDVLLPEEMLHFQECFGSFYLKAHTGRRLQWQNSMGTVVLKAKFPKGTKELVVSNFQAVVLMLFNEQTTLSYGEIRDQTNIPKAELDRTLQSLACGKARVLLKTPRGREVDESDSFAFNDTFTEKLFRIRVNQIQSRETPEENKETNEKVMLDRQYQIDAAVVRILKARRTLSHNLLMNELFTQLKFPVKSSDLKKRIESLIDREYLERDSRQVDQYVYLA